MVATTLLRSPLDELLLPVGDVLAFFDAASGDHITTGLRCSLVLRHGGKLLGRSVVTPSGLHVWPDLPERWRDPQAPVCADVVVRDDLLRFLPLSLPWPLPASAALVLRLAEQDLARLVVGDRLAQVASTCTPRCTAGRCGDGVEPGLQVRVLGQFDALVLPVAQPREGGDVGDGVGRCRPATGWTPGACR
jgi:hypothetical protein